MVEPTQLSSVSRMPAWHSRPSILSTWNEAVAGAFLSGATPNLFQQLQQNGQFTSDIGIPVPRACRMTRYGLIISSVGYTGTLTVRMGRSTDCGASYDVTDDVVAVNEPGESVKFCICGDLNILFDKCDLWRPNLLFSPNISLPRARLVVHFELR